MQINKVLFLFGFTISTINLCAQINPSLVFGLGKTIADGIKDKKKAKNIESSLTEMEINENKVKILRVPADKIISNAKGFVVRVQENLNEYHRKYLKGENIRELEEYATIHADILDIKAYDAEWPISYYETELKEYNTYVTKLAQLERQRKDSIDNAIRIAKQKEADSLNVVKKKIQDSIAYSERVNGYHFINKEFVNLKERPSEKSQTIGKLYLGSYAKVIGFSESSAYVKITLDDIEGFLKKDELVDNLDKITIANADIPTYKSRRYYKYEPNYDYTPASMLLYSEPANTKGGSSTKPIRKANTSRTYIRGPRGGCYYLTASGSKVYVDRSYCN